MKDWLTKNRDIAVAVVVTAVFLVANFVLMLRNDYWLHLLPVAVLGIALFVFKLETGLLVTALLTPFAIDIALVPGMELSMPVEPMMILYTGIFVFRVLLVGGYDHRLLRHPVTISVFCMLAWMLITACFSEIPDVSFKYLASRLWFVIPFFFSCSLFFRNKERIKQLIICYLISLVVVIGIATVRKLNNIYDLQLMYIVMQPFYNDHTAYGCVIALFLPITFHFLIRENAQKWLRIVLVVCFLALCVGLFFSYCRAAWISVAAAIAVYVAVKLGIKMKWMMLFAGVGIALFFVHQSDVMYHLGKNKQDSSLELSGQLKSISNISTDASNLERLNRWASAMRMFRERPVVGWGPGTYQFLYAGYQRSYQLSTISTNSGNRGNAHSEYIGPMTEQGVPGVIFVLAIFIFTFTTGVRVYRTAADPRVGRLTLALTLSLLTYYIHGVFNNFLDTDKLSVPFWAITAAIVALDVFSEKTPDPPEPKPSGSKTKSNTGKIAHKRSHIQAIIIVILLVASSNVRGQSLIYRSGMVTVGDLVIEEAEKYLGIPYRWGGKTPAGFDCAGFVRFIYGKFGVSLPGGAGGQYRLGSDVKDDEIAKGDLVFYGGRTGSSRIVGHVGIVTEVDSNGFYFIHSATSTGISISYSREPYYLSRYIGARRIIDRVVTNLPQGPVGIKKETPAYRTGNIW